ncbi:hypothetical protein AAVH_09051 [Aphelenchoides avenae]|nr:hypothetical protein AAVH_09051 [Aphelenchus avenae]
MDDTVFVMYVVPIFAASCLVVNIITLALIIRVKRKSTSNMERPEVNLFIIACVMVVVQCFNGSYQVVAYYISTHGLIEYVPTLIWHFPWINDVNNFSAAWVTLVASRRLRDAIFRRKQKIVSPTVVS